MTILKLGRLENVDLRSVFKSESQHFTPWLAQHENLALLGERIGLALELESTEKEVGPFRADILCKDSSTGAWVLIENQIERTDHSHLGQLLTYAAGLEAITIVWVAQSFTEEHRAALDWLNERTDDKVNLFGIEVELWQIEGSVTAPRFNVVSKPNYWTRSVKDGAEGKVTAYQELQREFWTAFRDYMEKQGSKIKLQKPLPQNWTNHALGTSGAYLTSVISGYDTETGKWDPEIRVELTVGGPNSKERFAELEARQAEIEQALGLTPTWYNVRESNTCRIFVRSKTDFQNRSLWSEQHEWLRTNLEAFQKVFAPIVRSFQK